MPRGAEELWWTGLVPGYTEEEYNDAPKELFGGALRDQLLQEARELLGEASTEYPKLKFVPVTGDTPKENKTNPPRSNSGLYYKLQNRTDAPLVEETLAVNGFLATQGNDWLIHWSGPSSKRQIHFVTLAEFQKVNHFPGSTELTRKDRMWEHFQEMAALFGDKVYDFLPETYVLPDQLEEFCRCYEAKPHYLWIVKPHASSRGRGIFILRGLEELPLDECSVVSRYIENPLLIQGLKFDLRIYVLVTSFDPLRAYIYREGLTRFASRPYSTEKADLDDLYAHLTNYSINKYAENFVENQDAKADNIGHKWSLSALTKHLKCLGYDVRNMWTRIHDVIIKTLLSVESSIVSNSPTVEAHRVNCFELYGFDILIDERLKPWLIEVNLSPSMQADSPLDRRIKGNLLSDSFNLVGGARISQQTLTQARWRAQLNYLSRQRSMFASSAADSMPRFRPGTRSGEDNQTKASETLAAFQNFNEAQLKVMVQILSEFGRSNNFIRLYPTKDAVYHFAHIADTLEKSRSTMPGRRTVSQFINAVLFGGKPPRPLKRPHSTPQFLNNQLLEDQDKTPQATETAVPQATETEKPSVTESENEQEKEAATAVEAHVWRRSSTMPAGDLSSWIVDDDEKGQDETLADRSNRTSNDTTEDPCIAAINAFGQTKGCRVLLIEYLLRLAIACESLTTQNKAKFAQSPLFPQLSTFRFVLFRNALFLPKDDKKTTGTRAQRGSSKAGEMDGFSGLIDDLSHAFRDFAEILAHATWPKEWSEGGQVQDVKGLIPSSVAKASVAVLTTIGSISATDLEKFLFSATHCSSEIRMLCEVPAYSEERRPSSASRLGNRRPLSGFAGQRLLSEVLRCYSENNQSAAEEPTSSNSNPNSNSIHFSRRAQTPDTSSTQTSIRPKSGRRATAEGQQRAQSLGGRTGVQTGVQSSGVGETSEPLARELGMVRRQGSGLAETSEPLVRELGMVRRSLSATGLRTTSSQPDPTPGFRGMEGSTLDRSRPGTIYHYPATTPATGRRSAKNLDSWMLPRSSASRVRSRDNSGRVKRQSSSSTTGNTLSGSGANESGALQDASSSASVPYGQMVGFQDPFATYTRNAVQSVEDDEDFDNVQNRSHLPNREASGFAYNSDRAEPFTIHPVIGIYSPIDYGRSIEL